jgi:hypothetical protein
MTDNCSEEKAALRALQSMYDQKRQELASTASGTKNTPRRIHIQKEQRQIREELLRAKAKLEECLEKTPRAT